MQPTMVAGIQALHIFSRISLTRQGCRVRAALIRSESARMTFTPDPRPFGRYSANESAAQVAQYRDRHRMNTVSCIGSRVAIVWRDTSIPRYVYEQ